MLSFHHHDAANAWGCRLQRAGKPFGPPHLIQLGLAQKEGRVFYSFSCSMVIPVLVTPLKATTKIFSTATPYSTLKGILVMLKEPFLNRRFVDMSPRRKFQVLDVGPISWAN